MIRTIIAAIPLLTPTLASAEVYEDLSNGWSVQVEGGSCLAVTVYLNGDVFVVGYNPADDRAALMITDAEPRSGRLDAHGGSFIVTPRFQALAVSEGDRRSYSEICFGRGH